MKVLQSTFWYNLGWSDLVGYIDGWIPRLSLSVPIFGYLILFNDTVGKALEFGHLTAYGVNDFGLNGSQRLRFIYFGLIALGVSNFIFRLKMPYGFRFGKNAIEYIKTCLDTFTLVDFLQVHNSIRREGHLTPDGRYYDSEWAGFVAAARNQGEGTDNVSTTANWDRAKSDYGSLLRSMLREQFFRQNTQSRGWLVLCITISSIGYSLLMIPSLDLFAKVLRSTLMP
jgi:hypothetical protein